MLVLLLSDLSFPSEFGIGRSAPEPGYESDEWIVGLVSELSISEEEDEKLIRLGVLPFFSGQRVSLHRLCCHGMLDVRSR